MRQLGLPAEEGQIAILAHTSSATGTPPDILARELQEHYAKDGLSAEFHVFKDLAGLKAAGLTLVVIKYSFMLDHYVTVLAVNETEVVVGDPARGKIAFTHSEFTKKWRRTGVVLRRRSVTKPTA